MFSKWDSINLETEYRKMVWSRKNRQSEHDEEPVLVQVQNNLYEVNLQTRKCYPIYLKCGKKMKVQRCLWYRDTNEPFDEKIGEEIEKRHVELFRDVFTNRLSGISLESASSPDDQFESSSIDSNSSKTGSKSTKTEMVKTQLER